MTVRHWITERTRSAPATLVSRMVAALGSDADAPSAQTTDVCLAAAARELERIVTEQRFERDSANDLLAIDALTTLAYEHASAVATSGEQIAEAAARGARAFGQLTLSRV